MSVDKSRLSRALSQPIYLNGVERTSDCWIFNVQSSTGHGTYNVTLSTTFTCTCPDSKRAVICKHRLFIICRVAQITDPNIALRNLTLLNDALTSVLYRVRITPEKEGGEDKKDIEDDEDTTCAICFETITTLVGTRCSDYSQSGIGCSVRLHSACAVHWIQISKNKRPACVQCRTPWHI